MLDGIEQKSRRTMGVQFHHPVVGNAACRKLCFYTLAWACKDEHSAGSPVQAFYAQ